MITGRTPGRRVNSRARRLVPLLVPLALVLFSSTAWGKVSHKNGSFSGATEQQTVSSGFRTIAFQVSKRNVTLTTEPTVAFGLCVSTSVFTIDGNPTARINGKGAFSFAHTHFGDEIDRIRGRFVSTTEIDGTATYFFGTTDLCTDGKTVTNFTASKGGKSKSKK